MTRALELRGVSYTPLGAPGPTLRDVSARFPRGAWTVVAGPTGSGKTTLLLAVAGILAREGAGALTGAVPDPAAAGPIGFVFQRPADAFCCETVAEEVAFGLENVATPPAEIRARVADAIAAVDMTAHADTNVLHLSGGQQQRVALACALASDAHWLLLDEPCSELDPAATRAFLALVDRLRRERDLGVVQAEHRLDSVMPYADELVVLDGGAVAWGGAFLDACRDGAVLRAHGLEVPGLAALCHEAGLAAAPRTRAEAERVLGDAALAPPPIHAADTGDAPVRLRVADLHAGHGRRGPDAVRALTWAVRAGERWAVLGPNGAGKSTLLHAVAGLVDRRRGTVAFGDGARGRLGLVLQDPVLMLTEPTVAEEVRLGYANPPPADEVAGWLADVGLAGREADPPLGLSHGERARLALAAVAAPGPDLLLLDEPTTGQDRAHLDRLLALLHKRAGARAVVFCTHDWDTALAVGTHALVLEAGRAAFAGPMAEAVHAAAAGRFPALPLPDALALRAERNRHAA